MAREVLHQARQADRDSSRESLRREAQKARRQHKAATRQISNLPVRTKDRVEASQEVNEESEGAAGNSQAEEQPSGDDGNDEEMGGGDDHFPHEGDGPHHEESTSDPKARKE